MPFDFCEKKERETSDEIKRIYVCECGDICVETRHSRQTFTPAEFVSILRNITMKQKNKRKILPVLQQINRIGGAILLAVLFLSACAKQSAETSSDKVKIVTVGGAITEIVYALGAGEKLVGTDTSSVFPEAATKLPQVGYQRTISAEGVISMKPSLVLILPEAGPPAAIQQIESAGIKIVRINNESNVDGTKAKIRQIAEAINQKEKGEELIKTLETELSEAEKLAATKTDKPKVVFIYSRGGGAAQVGGKETPADAMIKMAGGTNPITEFSEYKPLTPEALVAAAPDVILLPTRALASFGGIESVLNLPGVRETPAGKNKRIVTVDDTLLLGFTPRLGQGVKELCEKIHQ